MVRAVSAHLQSGGTTGISGKLTLCANTNRDATVLRRLLIETPLDVKRLRCNAPRAIDEVKRKVIQIQNGIDPNPNLYKRLTGRRKVDKKDFLVPRRILRLWR